MIERKSLTVELGCGELFLPITAPRDKFSKGNTYLGIDLPVSLQKSIYHITPNDGIHDGLWRLNYLEPETRQNIHFVYANMNRLPLADGVADEVYIANVLNDPALQNTGLQFKPLFTEIRRILKDSGKLVVYTDTFPLDPRGVESLIQLNGFEILEKQDARSPKGMDAIKRYSRLAITGPDFMFVATPKR